MPKPLVEIGGLPIVWHVIQLYAAQGFGRFLLATGYQGELIAALRRRAQRLGARGSMVELRRTPVLGHAARAGASSCWSRGSTARRLLR